MYSTHLPLTPDDAPNLRSVRNAECSPQGRLVSWTLGDVFKTDLKSPRSKFGCRRRVAPVLLHSPPVLAGTSKVAGRRLVSIMLSFPASQAYEICRAPKEYCFPARIVVYPREGPGVPKETTNLIWRGGRRNGSSGICVGAGSVEHGVE